MGMCTQMFKMFKITLQITCYIQNTVLSEDEALRLSRIVMALFYESQVKNLTAKAHNRLCDIGGEHH